MSELRGVKLLDANNVPIGSLNGAINVHNAGVHFYPINDYFHTHTGVSTTLTVASIIGATSVTVASVVGFAIGNDIQIGGHVSADITYTKIINIIGNVIYINRPLGNTRAIGSIVEKVNINMATTIGTIAAPISYKVVPSDGLVWHVERIMLSMIHTTAGDMGLFGNITSLTNGCVLRKYNGVDGTFSTFDVWQNNSDIYLDFANLSFITRSGGGGAYGTVGSGSFSEIGVTIKLEASLGDYMEILIQDNISGLVDFRLKVQGHLESV